MTLPHQSSPQRPLDKLEYTNDDGGTVTTVGESIDTSSDSYSLDLTPIRRKKQTPFPAYHTTTTTTTTTGYLDQQTSTTLLTTLTLLTTFTLFSLLQLYGFHTIAHLQPPPPPSTTNTPHHPRFTNTNPHIHNWCPTATCHNSPLCQPCNRRFLIIIATGRSGSTTLNNMFDLLPGVRMAGENNGHLEYGFRAWKNLERTESFGLRSLRKVEGAWRHNPIPEQSTSCPLQMMFESINPPSELLLRSGEGLFGGGGGGGGEEDTILGFKTVQMHDALKFDDTPEESVEFLIKTFPCARFVINIRGDMEAQSRSWRKAFGTNMDGDLFRGFNRRLERIAAQLGPGRARLIDMSEWSQRDGSGVYLLNDTLEWLGFKGCRFPSLLHSNKNGYGADTTKYSLGDDCHRIGE